MEPAHFGNEQRDSLVHNSNLVSFLRPIFSRCWKSAFLRCIFELYYCLQLYVIQELFPFCHVILQNRYHRQVSKIFRMIHIGRKIQPQDICVYEVAIETAASVGVSSKSSFMQSNRPKFQLCVLKTGRLLMCMVISSIFRLVSLACLLQQLGWKHQVGTEAH